MGNLFTRKSIKNVLIFISFLIPLIFLILILNWFFNLTSYQRLEGAPILLSPFGGIIGLALCYLASKSLSGKIIKTSLVMNVVLLTLPFLYMFLGTLFGGV